MKYLRLFLLISIVVIIAYSCSKEKSFLEENTTPTSLGSVPVSTNALQNVSVNPAVNLATTSGSATLITAGTTFNAELQFFSNSPIKEINLYATVGTATKALAATIPYKSAYSNSKKLDTLLVPYTVPSGAAGTVIRLDYEILNVNTLNVVRTVYVKR